METAPTEVAAKPKPRLSRRERRLILGGLLLVPIAFLAKWLFIWPPEGWGGPAGPDVPREPFQRTWTTRPVLLLGLGDSVTEGFGSSFGNSYIERLEANPPDDPGAMRGICLKAVFPKLRSDNRSQSFTTSPQHLRDQIDLLKEQKPDTLGWVVMTTGGNDVIHDYGQSPPKEAAMYGATMEQARPWVTTFEKRLNEMLDKIEKRFPGGCHVFLADIFDPTDGVGDIERTRIMPRWPDGEKVLAAYNAVVHRASGRKNVHVVPVHDAFLGHGLHAFQFWQPHYHLGDPFIWYYKNIEDPNDRGYDAIRRLFLIEMAKVGPGLEGGAH